MAYELENNVLVLHKNKFKTEDKHPSYRGQVLVEGVKKDASMWINTNKNGEKYIRIKLEKPYVKPDGVNASTTTAPEFAGNSSGASDGDLPY